MIDQLFNYNPTNFLVDKRSRATLYDIGIVTTDTTAWQHGAMQRPCQIEEASGHCTGKNGNWQDLAVAMWQLLQCQ